MLRRRIAISLIVFCLIVVVATLGCVIWVANFLMPRVLSDFAALWGSTDALTHYVITEKEWPAEWKQLAPSFAFVDPMYKSCNLTFVTDRIIINFDIDIDAPLGDDQWFVRLKSGGIQPEEEAANERIRASIESHQLKSSNERELEDTRQL